MSLFHDSALVGASGQAGGAGYSISRSIRLNSADSAYLSRTPASAGNRKTWTWAGWVKKAKLGNPTYQATLSAGTSNTDINYIFVGGYGLDDAFGLIHYNGSFVCNIETTNVFRDVSAWYHLLVAVDTTQATASNRVKIYVNGSQVTSFSSSIYPSQDHQFNINNTSIHHIGSIYGTRFLDAYLADIHFIDGQALDPTSFGEFSATTGVWVPKAYTGTYGTNGFRLDFADNSAATATTLGKDAAGSNNWTPNNLSVTAGAGNDSLVDVPTNGSEVDTGLGGQVRGNYATWNPIDAGTYIAARNGNLDAYSTTTSGQAFRSLMRATVGVTTGKWYWEVTVNALPAAAGNYFYVGVDTLGLGSAVNDYIGGNQGNKGFGLEYSNTGTVALYSSFWGSTYQSTNPGTISAGTVIGFALNSDTGTLGIYYNGVSKGNAYINLTQANLKAALVPAIAHYGNAIDLTANFGQRPFAYTAPSGFKALCTANLPAPVVTKPSDVMDVKLITANNSTQAVTGLGFSPDLVWTKSRSNAFSHYLYDTVRGASKFLISNATNAEATIADSLISFDSSGFTLGANDGANYTSGASVAWCWDAGTTTVTNTQGSITSSVRANATAGFSVVSWTAPNPPGSITSVGHGLGATPHMMIFKNRDLNNHWTVYHRSFTNQARNYLKLETTDAVFTRAADLWGTINSTVFNVDQGFLANANERLIAYCFAPQVGYSSMGSYVGNGNTSGDGPFIYTGHLSRWLLIKRTDVASDWLVFDTARDSYNQSGLGLRPNLADAEYDDRGGVGTSYTSFDFLSNGFKVRGASTRINTSGGTYVYASFAQHPFQYARAR